MASLRELVQTLLPSAVPLAKVRDESMARTVTWVRVMRMRLPAFDGMESGDLALIPLSLLITAAPDTQSRADLAEYLADHGSTGVLLLGEELSPTQWVGVACVLGGMMIYRPAAERRPTTG